MANELERQRYIRSLSRDDLKRLVSIFSFSPLFGLQENIPLMFTRSEIEKLPKTFKKEFRTDGCTAHIYRRKIGKESYTYDIKYRRNSYNVTVTDKNLDVAKKKFIEKLKTAEKVTKTTARAGTAVPTTFNAFANYYFENFRKKKVAKLTLKSDLCKYRNYIKPYFKETPIKKITPADCQKLLDSIFEEGKGKTATDVHGLLSVIFKTAILHGIISTNPLNIVILQKHEKTHGTALSKDEEKKLLNYFKGTRYEQSFALLLYCGLRPNELETAKVNGKFIVAKNSKRKNGKVEYKKIPISPMLAPYVTDKEIVLIENKNVNYLRTKMKEALPNHILYDLRTTFYSRLKECGVADNAINEYVGHSLGILGNTYTDLSDEYLLKEGKKFKY